MLVRFYSTVRLCPRAGRASDRRHDPMPPASARTPRPAARRLCPRPAAAFLDQLVRSYLLDPAAAKAFLAHSAAIAWPNSPIPSRRRSTRPGRAT